MFNEEAYNQYKAEFKERLDRLRKRQSQLYDERDTLTRLRDSGDLASDSTALDRVAKTLAALKKDERVWYDRLDLLELVRDLTTGKDE